MYIYFKLILACNELVILVHISSFQEANWSKLKASLLMLTIDRNSLNKDYVNLMKTMPSNTSLK